MTAAPTHRWAWWDLVPALPLLVIGIGGTRGAAEGQIDAVQPDLIAYLLVAVAALSLLLRRRNPLVGLMSCGAAVASYLALGYPFGPILFTGPCAVYAVVVGVELRRALLASGGFVVATAMAAIPGFADTRGWFALFTWVVTWSAVVAAPAAIGMAINFRRESAAEVRAEQARRALSEERLRLAQDVHDVVGHGLAVIAMQAGVALHVLGQSPDRARRSLEAIRSTSREALDGLRAELDQLRAPPGATALRQPARGLADVPAMVERMRAAGVDVKLHQADVGPLPAAVGAAVYRIVQESLTNVLRHAPTATATVTVERSAGELVITVTDSGPHARQPGGKPGDHRERRAAGGGHRDADVTHEIGGMGIDGMRARAAALGGTLVAVPSGAGFAVRARLPIADRGPEQ